MRQAIIHIWQKENIQIQGMIRVGGAYFIDYKVHYAGGERSGNQELEMWLAENYIRP